MRPAMMAGFLDELSKIKIAYTEEQLYNMARGDLQFSEPQARKYVEQHKRMGYVTGKPQTQTISDWDAAPSSAGHSTPVDRPRPGPPVPDGTGVLPKPGADGTGVIPQPQPAAQSAAHAAPGPGNTRTFVRPEAPPAAAPHAAPPAAAHAPPAAAPHAPAAAPHAPPRSVPKGVRRVPRGGGKGQLGLVLGTGLAAGLASGIAGKALQRPQQDPYNR